MGPDRGLQTVVLDDVPAPEHVTFEPDMISNQMLRDTVVSSGYGAHVPAPRVAAKVVDPEETFDPALISSKDGQRMRQVVPSSGYGRGQVPDHKAKAKKLRSERKRPSFQPVINRTKFGHQVYKQVTSAKYGRKVPAVVEKAPPKLKHKFRPTLRSDPELRQKTPSSGYADYNGYEDVDPEKSMPIAITNRARRRSMEGSVSSPFESLDIDPENPTVVSKRVSMYTLLSPEAQPYVRPEDEVDPEPEIPFILDGERVSNHLYPRVKGLSLKYIPTVVPELPMPTSPLKEHFNSQVQSHGYGSEAYFPDVADKPEEKDCTPQWNITKDNLQVLSDEALAAEAELEAQLTRETLSKQFEHVGSSKYGQIFPTVATKKEMPEPKTAWLAAGPARPTIPVPEDAPLSTTRLMVDVQSAGYGRVSPPKAYRPEKEPAPVWVPSSSNPGSPAVEAPPSSKYRTQVRTQYDHQYFPE